MIRVTVELLPGGDTVEPVVLGTAGLANVTPSVDPAAYVAVVQGPGQQWTTVIEGHNRSRGVWALVAAMLEQPPAGALTVEQERNVEAILERLGPHDSSD